MSPNTACASQGAAPFPDLFASPSWFEAADLEPPCDRDNPFEPPTSEVPFSNNELARLAQAFMERSKTLIDAVAPPAWEDRDDILGGEVFEEERAEYQRLSAANPTCTHRSAIVRELMANEAARYPGCTDDFLVALALTYRHIMLDQAADPRDKLEIVQRVYTRHEPQWMTAEIVYLHFVLLDQCRYLARPSASIERKEETLRWIFTDPELEDRPFSFKNCVRLVTGNAPEYGAVYRRLKEELRPALSTWLRESHARRRGTTDGQSQLFDM